MQHPTVAAIQRELDAARSEVTETRKAIAEVAARNGELTRDLKTALADVRDANTRATAAWIEQEVALLAAQESAVPQPSLPLAADEPTSRTVARARHEGMA